MIDNYLLEYLTQFRKLGTIEKVAQTLGVTKATVSRGLRKLETELNTQLFDRQPQKIILTKTGEFAAVKAAQIIDLQTKLIPSVQNFATKQVVIQVSGTVPGPLWLLKTIKSNQTVPFNIDSHLIEEHQIIPALTNHRFGMIISPHNINTARVTSTLLGTEQLFIKVTKLNPLYNHSDVTLKELAGHEFIVDQRLGEWSNVLATITPNAQFLYQNDAHSMDLLIQHSNFPIFKTSITNYLDHTSDRKRRLIPIRDSAAKMKLYANYLQSDYQIIQPIIRLLQNKLQTMPNK
jgi:DNA-binding transcriptional LysR family regulator